MPSIAPEPTATPAPAESAEPTTAPAPTSQPWPTESPAPTTRPGTLGVVDGTEGAITWTYDQATKTVTVTGKGTRGSQVGRARSAYAGASSFPEETLHVRFRDCEIAGSLAGLFKDLSQLQTIDFTGLHMNNITDMRHMLDGCANLAEVSLQNFATENVTDMAGMFSGCAKLTSLDLGSFDTGNVKDMADMFSGCAKLTELNLRSFDTGNVTDMAGMFSGCTQLSTLDLSSFDTENVTDMTDMLSGCDSLQTLHAPRKMGNAAAALPGTYADPDGNQVTQLTSDASGLTLTKVRVEEYLISSDYEEIKEGLETEEIRLIDYVLPDGDEVAPEEQKEVFTRLQDSGKTLSFVFQDEEGEEVYRWTFQGNEIKYPEEKVDFQIIVDAKVPEVLEVVPEDVQSVDLKFINEGLLPGMANIKVQVEAYFEADRLYLYYYNPDTGALELVDDNVAFDGIFASFYLDHNSNYVLTAEMLRNLLPQKPDPTAKPDGTPKPEQPTNPDNTGRPSATTNPGNTAKPEEPGNPNNTVSPETPVSSSEPTTSDGSESSQGGASDSGSAAALIQYTVVRGDTLSRIARRYQTTVSQLLALNPGIKNPNLIYIGQILTVGGNNVNHNQATQATDAGGETGTGKYHVVQRGDSFYRISRKYGIPLKDLMNLNARLAAQKYIFPGQKMLLQLENAEQ